MEPATLYILYKLAAGEEHLYAARFPSMAVCEFKKNMKTYRPPAGVAVLESVCWEYGTRPPEWLRKRIDTVPLDPQFQSTG
jgi:hypothetical protein